MIPFAPGEVDGLADVWLDTTVTLEAPSGSGWTTQATGVAAGIQTFTERVFDSRTASLLEQQHSALLVRKTVTVADNWRVTDETTGQRYTTREPIRNAAAPLWKVPLKATH